MGPFRLIDEVGIDIANEVGKILCNAFPYLQESPLLQKIENAGLLGRKKQRGFYSYRGNKQQQANEDILSLLPSASKTADNTDWRRLMMLMVAEATRCLEGKVVSSAEDIDTGMVFGTGFPPFRGGLCRWADQLTLTERRVASHDLAEKHGERFEFSSDYQKTLQFYKS
jgi:3-hydroxyacyl-CoA dehydrogenase/enoyl-CoA hydratase/3-hydroxybutyryl-CoA epimerase